jgi:alanine racemase
MMIDSLYPDIPAELAGAVLTIDLAALTQNYTTLAAHFGGSTCGAVLKADGYGLDAQKVGPALANAGCSLFFVAHINEGIRLRSVLPEAEIHILHGSFKGAEGTLVEHNLVPMLGSLQEIEDWKRFCGDDQAPCDLHIDTGMLRLGLPPSEMQHLTDNTDLIGGMNIELLASHLASADEPQSPQNAAQLAAFNQARRLIPHKRASLCNSSGLFLGMDYHFDVARPGVALYGVNPTPDKPNPMMDVVSLRARIIQVRDAMPSDTVGYNATYAVSQPTRVATVAVGYADGLPRSLSNKSCGYIDSHRVPLIGRVSMDLITFDVSNVPHDLASPGQWIELLGSQQTVDDMARDAGTIGYEILTSLGRRYHRVYKGG